MENKDITIKMNVAEVVNCGNGGGSKAVLHIATKGNSIQGASLELYFDDICPIELGYYEMTLKRVE